MTSINGVGGATGATFPSVEPGAGLDGDTILLYCQTQLNDLGRAVNSRMAEQRAAREQKQLLNELRGTLGNYVANGIPQPQNAEREAILRRFDEVLAKMPEGPNKAALLHSRNNLSYAHHGVSKEHVEGIIKDIDLAADEIGKNAELEMINLQQLLSQRQMAIQMSTNMLNKYSQGLEAITANIGK